MKITKRQLRRIIREERVRLIKEQAEDPRAPSPMVWEYPDAAKGFANKVYSVAADIGRTALEPAKHSRFMKDLRKLFDSHGIG